MYELDSQEQVCVTFTVSQWAQVVASVASSGLELFEKECINAKIFDTVMRAERSLS
jgi:hypothetical protein